MSNSFGPIKNAAGSIHAGNSPVSVLATGSITGIASSTLSTIVTYTNTSGSQESVSRVAGSGTVPAIYLLVLNTVTIEEQRSGPDYKVNFAFNGPLKLDNGDILELKVRHGFATTTRDFQSSIYGV